MDRAATERQSGPLIYARPHVRWMIRRDIPEVVAIEKASFERPRGEEEILGMLRCEKCIGMVAETGDRVSGFMVYELRRGSIYVLDLATHPGSRRRGIGHSLAFKLRGKLSPMRRTAVVVDVRESNLPAQMFFRDCDFQATKVVREHFRDTGEDAYRMEYRLGD